MTELDSPYMTMGFTELETLALQVKIKMARHYAGNKLATTEFFSIKHIDIVYNLRSWAEGDKMGPNRLNKLAKKLVK